MALKKSVVATTTEGSNFVKADAFLNLYIPSPNGRRKIGAIPFKSGKALDAAMIARLSEDPEGAVIELLKVLQLDFKLVTNEPMPASALGF